MLNKYLVEAGHKLEGDDHMEFVIKTLEGLQSSRPPPAMSGRQAGSF